MDLHRRLLNTFFKNLVDQGILGHTPMVCWKKKRKERVSDPSKAERVFSDEDLQTIFAPETFIDWARKAPHRFWGPILGLYTGARINEIAQLKLADIVKKNDTWWMHIRATVDEDLRGKRGRNSRASVKCLSSIRCIPIAQPVLDAGFLDFIADIREAKHERLFPNLSAGPDTNRARYGVGLSNQFGAYMKALGFPSGVRFHAFRHTFVTVLLDEKVGHVDIASITGHALDLEKVDRVVAYGHVGSPKRPAKKLVVDERRQIEVVAAFHIPVALPHYERGQFRNQLKWGARIYP
jgi:integrase